MQSGVPSGNGKTTGPGNTVAEAAYASRPLKPHRLDALRRHVRGSYLDVGCGNGGYVREAATTSRAFGVGWRVFPDWHALPGRFAVGETQTLPFAGQTFDTVSSFETLEHLPDPVQALSELRRVAQRVLLLTVPNCEVSSGQRASNLIYHHWNDPTHRNFWTFDELVSFAGTEGWVVAAAERINNIDLIPIILKAFAPSGLRGKFARQLLTRLQRRSYAMTTLVVSTRTRT